MNYIVQDELEKLKLMLEEGKMETDKSNNFIDVSHYEDEYSHNEVNDIQADFLYYAKKYLQENYKEEYAIIHGIWCVHIITIDFLNIKNLKGWQVC